MTFTSSPVRFDGLCLLSPTWKASLRFSYPWTVLIEVMAELAAVPSRIRSPRSVRPRRPLFQLSARHLPGRWVIWLPRQRSVHSSRVGLARGFLLILGFHSPKPPPLFAHKRLKDRFIPAAR